MSVFDRDAKLAKAAYIFREQERRESERKKAFDQCKEKVQEEFFNYLTTQNKHEGSVGCGTIFYWMGKYDECREVEPRHIFPSETLEGKISYDYDISHFNWKLKN